MLDWVMLDLMDQHFVLFHFLFTDGILVSHIDYFTASFTWFIIQRLLKISWTNILILKILYFQTQIKQKRGKSWLLLIKEAWEKGFLAKKGFTPVFKPFRGVVMDLCYWISNEYASPWDLQWIGPNLNNKILSGNAHIRYNCEKFITCDLLK